MNMRIACPDSGVWNDLLDGRVSNPEQPGLNAHLENCLGCQQTVERLTAGDTSWPEAAQGLGQRPRPALRQVMERLKAKDEVAMETVGLATVGDASLPFLGPSANPEHLGRIGPYEVLEVIGRGGMGVVLKTFDPLLGRMAAIKVLAPQLATNAAARRRFAREARHTAQVRHQNVVAVQTVDEVDGLPYLVMEYVPGVSLQQHLDRVAPLELEELLRIGMQAASGLAAAHSEGLVHRDIKPANILLDTAGNVKLTDFGLARAVDDASLTQSGVIAGTPQYMAPEQARGEPLDHRADLFSLGSVLYAMCTGRPPFRAPTALAVLKRVCEDTPTDVRDINPETPDWLAAIIDKLHAKNPGDRFQTADKVASLLSRHLRNHLSPTTFKKPRALPQPRAATSRSWWPLSLLVSVVVGLPILAGGIAFWFSQMPDGNAPQLPERGRQAQAQDDVPIEKILADLDNHDVFTRRDALKRLANMKPNEKRAEVAKKLAGLTDIEDPHVRRPAVSALGTWGSTTELPALIKAIEHSDVFTKREALKVVGRFRDERVVGPVIRCFRESLMRADATQAIRDLGTMAEKDVLALMAESDVFLKQATVNVLADIGTDASVPALRAAAASGNIFLVEPAQKALTAIAARQKK
jgi:serine/threonine protein kinase